MTVLTDAATTALRDIYEHGTDADRERARLMLIERGLIRDPDVERRARIRTGGPMALGREVMADTVTGPASPLHDFLNDWHLAEAGTTPGAMCATAAPRGHGKSTAGVELPALFHAAYCTRRFQLIVSDTDDQAVARIAAIKAQAESNDELRDLFPRLRPAQPGAWARADDDDGGVWRERDIVFACGCRISARGAGTSMRGMKHRNRRPDLVYLDDLEDEKSVATPYQIEKRLAWLQRVVLGLAGHGEGAGLSVLWVGTILSRAALLNLATGAALDEGQVRPPWATSWFPRVFRAELDGTPRIATTATVQDPLTGAEYEHTREVGEPMWSGWVTRVDLVKLAAKVGDDSYAAEYQSDPADRADGVLKAPPLPALFLNPHDDPRSRIVRTSTGLVVPVASMTVAVALDPQFAEEGSSNDPDLAAVVAVGQWGAYSFILDSWIGRDRFGQAGTLVRMALAWGAFTGVVEVNAAQVLVADQAAQMAAVPIMRRNATDGKEARALGPAVRLQQERVFILPGGDNGELPRYLKAFPHGRYKDPVDAFVMALEAAATATPVESGGQGSSPAAR